jgi:hypothetical protein
MTRTQLNTFEAEVIALRQQSRNLRADADAADARALHLENTLSQYRFTQLEEESSASLSANNWPAILQVLQHHVKPLVVPSAGFPSVSLDNPMKTTDTTPQDNPQ